MKIHFIGIGGIGVSALAQYYLAKGHQITGSDLVCSEITEALKKKGVKVFIGKHLAKHIFKDLDLVVYSPAVTQDNPEFKKAKRLKLKLLSYPQALGELTKNHFTIAIAGSHGKSTVTAMIGLLLVKAGLDPTVIVGTKLKEFDDSNCRVGKSQYLVIEADEHFASLLNYWPQMMALITLEAEHLDFYKNLKNLIRTFKDFVSHLGDDGVLVANGDDKNIAKLLTKTVFREKNVLLFSLKQKEAKRMKKVLKIPGDFNVSNALAALNVARALKIPDQVSFLALSEYQGAWRRFDMREVKLVGKSRKIIVIDDYAHHPTKVRVTLKAAREKYPKKVIWCVFQPHQYQRTYYLFDDFVEVLRKAPVDKLIITDIYTVVGREKKEIMRKVDSQKLVEAIGKDSVSYLPREEVNAFLKRNLKGGEVVIFMGAGDIYELSLRWS